MIRLFLQLCKCYKQISFENEINNFNEQLKSLNIEDLECPFCGARHALSTFASYDRHLVTYENNTVHDNLVNISRCICSSCGHTHALLPL
jgi:C4-type Zn-finger protein